MSALRGSRVQNMTTGETGFVLYGTQDGRLRVQVDPQPDDPSWQRSIIGPPSRITATWERWDTSLRGENDC